MNESDAGEMDYYEVAPDPRLLPFVRCIWGLRMEGAPPEPDRVLPDGCCELVIHCGDFFMQHAAGGVQRQPRQLFVGPSARAIVISPGSFVDLVAIRFEPGGAALLLGPQPLYELRDLALDCTDAGIRFGFDIIDAFGKMDARRRVAALEHMLLRRLSATTLDRGVAHARKAIVDSGGAVRIAELARHSGISTRQLQRRFQRDVGFTPKVLARVVRLHRASIAGQQPDATLARIAAGAGYADQSHFTRDFTEIAGVSPAAFFRHSHALNDLFATE